MEGLFGGDSQKVDLGRGDPTTLAIVLNWDPHAPNSVKDEYLKTSIVLSMAQIAIFLIFAINNKPILKIMDFDMSCGKLVSIMMFHLIVKNDLEDLLKIYFVLGSPTQLFHLGHTPRLGMTIAFMLRIIMSIIAEVSMCILLSQKNNFEWIIYFVFFTMLHELPIMIFRNRNNYWITKYME
jgi:hypothetical protein